MRERPASPAVWNAAKGAPSCLTPSRSWRCAAWHGGGRALGEADRALRGYPRDMGPTSCFTESPRKPAHELLGAPHLQVPPAGSQTAAFASPTHNPAPCLTPCVYPEGGKYEPLQRAGEHAQKTSLRDSEKAHRLKYQFHTKESTWLSAHGLALQG